MGLADHKILGTRCFAGLSDTLRILIDAAADVPAAAASGAYEPARLAQLQQELESVTRSHPTTLVASRRCLDQLAASAAVVVAGMEALGADPKEPIERVGPCLRRAMPGCP
jgi:hypothetical protein